MLIRCLFAVMLMTASIFAPAHAQGGNRAVFIVPEVPVFAEADSAAQAQSIAQDRGRRRAMDILLRRLTAEEDWGYLPNLTAGEPASAVAVAPDFDFDYWEIYGILTYALDGASIAGSVWYADNYFGEVFFNGTSAIAVETVVTFDLPENFALSGTIGRQTFDEAGGIGDQDYTYYDVGVSKVWNDLTFDVRWHDATGVTPALASSDNVGALAGSVTFSF